MGNNCFRISQHPTDSIFIQDNDDDDNDYTDPQHGKLCNEWNNAFICVIIIYSYPGPESAITS